MNHRDFVYWLQGFFELSQAEELDKEKVQQIKDHLKLCFTKVTPDYSPYISPILFSDTLNLPANTGVSWGTVNDITGQQLPPASC